jgi:hypothetical protein
MEEIEAKAVNKGRPKKSRKKLTLTFEEIYRKLQDSRFHIIHMKSTMKPVIYSEDEHCFFSVPDGYMEFDSEKRRKGYL